MKKYLFSLSIGAALLFVTAVQTPAQEGPSAETVMQRVASKLASVKALGYKYRFELNQPSQERSFRYAAQGYLDLRPADGAGEFKYQFLSDDRLAVYNGTESFIADKESKKLWVETNPSFQGEGSISLMNSPLTLKYALPRLIADKAIQKKLSVTKVDGRDRYLVEFSLRKAAINTIGEIFELRVDQTTSYRLTIDRRTFLPVEVLRTNDKNDESVKVSFEEITEEPSEPAALSWYFSTYQNEYRLEKKDRLTLIQTGQTAPEFQLAGFGSNSQISLEQYRGRVVLIEFWITQCHFCIEAVPKLNGISERFGDKGLQLVSINMYDAAATIDSFKKKNKPVFTILTGGDSIAIAYGVEAYPAIVLIGKDGKVVYSSSGLFEKELEAAIVTQLQ